MWPLAMCVQNTDVAKNVKILMWPTNQNTDELDIAKMHAKMMNWNCRIFAGTEMRNTDVAKKLKILVVQNTDGETIKYCKSAGQVCTNTHVATISEY